MSAILQLLPFFGSTNETDGLAALKDVLVDRQTTLELDAVYGRPTIDTQGETTAVFPVVLYYDGDKYGRADKEFPIPDNGLEDTDAPLTQFLHGKGISSVEELDAIDGFVTGATLKESGDIEVGE